MRRALYSFIFLIPAARAFAHHDDEELGHHWASPSYAGELRFQFLVMLCVIALLAAAEVIKHVRRTKR